MEEKTVFSYMARDWPQYRTDEDGHHTDHETLALDVKDIIRAIEDVKNYIPLIRQFATPEHNDLNPNEWAERHNYHFARQAALAITKLDEARLWAGEMLYILEEK